MNTFLSRFTIGSWSTTTYFPAATVTWGLSGLWLRAATLPAPGSLAQPASARTAATAIDANRFMESPLEIVTSAALPRLLRCPPACNHLQARRSALGAVARAAPELADRRERGK